MRQAIEEGFILDVLQHYIDYNTYFRIVKQADDDPELPKRRTSVALAKFLSLHPVNVSQRTEVIVEHFREHVRHLMGGRAKAMVVTSSRLSAVRYMQAFERYIAEHGYDDVRPLVAFSGTVTDPDTGEEFTEPGMNTDVVTGRSIGEAALPGRFASPDYQILLVAEKYQTGFDQPLLQAMYVDKRLDGVQAVQTLSRLNRIAPGKAPPFVLDFVNDPEGIRAAFAPYYDRTELEEASDPYRLEELRHELDGMQVYHHAEVEEFARAYYRPRAKRRHGLPRPPRGPVAAHGRPLRRPRRGRPDRLPRPPRRVREPVRLPQPDHPLRRRRPRTPRLVRPHAAPPPAGRQRQHPGPPRRRRGARVLPPAAHVGGTDPHCRRRGRVRHQPGRGRDRRPRGGQGAALGDHRAPQRPPSARTSPTRTASSSEQVKERAVRNDEVRRLALANAFDKFALDFRPQLGKLMVERMGENDVIVTRFLDDAEFQQTASDVLAREVYEAVGEPAAERPSP